SRLERIDWAAFSRMPMTSLACTTSMGKSAALRWEAISALISSLRPTSSTRANPWRAAWMAPSTSGLGARSDPMASTAMVTAAAGAGAPSVAKAVRAANRMRARTRREENLRFRGRRFGATAAPQKLLLGFNVQDFAPFIVAAFGAGTMRHLAFVAIRALGKRMRGQKIVGAAA